MGKVMRLVLACVLVPALLAIAPVAYASSNDVTHRGACSSSSHWQLELNKESGGRIEADLEVYTNAAGQTWRIRMADNGTLFWHGRRTTESDGNFDVDKYTTDLSGSDTIVGRSVSLTTGEVCRAKATIS